MSKKIKDQKHYEVITQEDENGDLIVPIPPELLEQLGWKEGDNINFVANADGGFTLKKV